MGVLVKMFLFRVFVTVNVCCMYCMTIFPVTLQHQKSNWLLRRPHCTIAATHTDYSLRQATTIVMFAGQRNDPSQDFGLK